MVSSDGLLGESWVVSQTNSPDKASTPGSPAGCSAVKPQNDDSQRNDLIASLLRLSAGEREAQLRKLIQENALVEDASLTDLLSQITKLADVKAETNPTRSQESIAPAAAPDKFDQNSSDIAERAGIAERDIESGAITKELPRERPKSVGPAKAAAATQYALPLGIKLVCVLCWLWIAVTTFMPAPVS